MLRAPAFDVLVPESLYQAACALADLGPSAVLLGGGTDLIPNLKRRTQVPKVLISLRAIPELRRLERMADGSFMIGAGVTLGGLQSHPGIRGPNEALFRAVSQVATPQIRNTATVGGNLCLDTRCTYYNQSYDWRTAIDFCMKAPGPQGVARFESPDAGRQGSGSKDGSGQEGTCWVAPGSPRCWAVSSSDLAPALIALGAHVILSGREGGRVLPLEHLYGTDGMGYLTKRPDELLAGVGLDAPAPGQVSTYWKLRRRNAFDFPALGVAAMVVRTPEGVVTRARVVLGAVESRPLLLEDASRLVGTRLEDEALEAFADAAAPQARPMDNTDFSLSWRKKVARQFLVGALRELRGDSLELLGVLARHVVGSFGV